VLTTAVFELVYHATEIGNVSAGFRWWGPGAQAWWEAPCADTESLGRWWSMKSLVFPRIVYIY